MTEREVVWQHLTLYKRGASSVWISSFLAALRDARRACKRNPRTGKKHRHVNHGSWIGTLTYLIFLDQVGKSFKPSGQDRLYGKPIAVALQHFGKGLTKPELTPFQIDAICALRNAFAHDYSLFNQNAKEESLHQHFTVSVRGPLVVLRQKQWDGSLTVIPGPEQETTINLEALQDLVELIYFERLLVLARAGELEIILPGGVDGLRSRYGLGMPWVKVRKTN